MKRLFKRKKLLIIIIICINCILVRAASGSFTVGKINPIDASADIVNPPKIIFDNDNLKISFKVGDIKDSFLAKASTHNRIAKYEFDVIYLANMTVNGEKVIGDYLADEGGTYLIKVSTAVRYKTSDLNIRKGWPRYYNISSKSELYIDGGEPVTPIEKILKARVNHTVEWDKKRLKYNFRKGYEGDYNNRIGFNEYMEKVNPRYRNVFWPGENFILECTLNDVSVSKIEVYIENTDFKTILKRKSGDMFTGIMLNNDRYINKPKELVFVFKASETRDRVSIIIDGRDEYWGFHRKK